MNNQYNNSHHCKTVDNLTQTMNTMKLDQCEPLDTLGMDMEIDREVQCINSLIDSIHLIDDNIDDIREENLERFRSDRYIPLEVNNLICDKYFDDEDFIYYRLQLPIEIIDHISHTYQGDLIDYFSTILTHTNREEFVNQDVYYNIISAYQYILNYYQQSDSLQATDKIKTFPQDYFNGVSLIINELRQQLKLTENVQPQYRDMDIIDQELSYGLNMVVSHIHIIIKFYQKCGMNVYQLTDKHIKRFVRLVNNLSVIMIYFKFYTVDLLRDRANIPNLLLSINNDV